MIPTPPIRNTSAVLIPPAAWPTSSAVSSARTDSLILVVILTSKTLIFRNLRLGSSAVRRMYLPVHSSAETLSFITTPNAEQLHKLNKPCVHLCLMQCLCSDTEKNSSKPDKKKLDSVRPTCALICASFYQMPTTRPRCCARSTT